MTQQQTPFDIGIHTLTEMARFHRSYELTRGDKLTEEVARIKRYFSPADWALEIWNLAREARLLIERYAGYVHNISSLSGSDHALDEEFTLIENMVDAITGICDELGIEELRNGLQRDLTNKAEGGAFRHDQTVYLEVAIQNPSMVLWDHLELKQAIDSSILPKLEWPPGFTPRRFVVVEVLQSDLQACVTVTVRVDEKIQS